MQFGRSADAKPSHINVSFIIYADDTLFPSALVRAAEKGSSLAISGAVVSVALDGMQLVNMTEPIVLEFQVRRLAVGTIFSVHSHSTSKIVRIPLLVGM